MKKIHFALGALFLSLTHGIAQENNFFNPAQNLVLTNPSFAGSNGFVRNQTSFQGRFIGYPGSPRAFVSATDIYLQDLKAGVSATGRQEEIGPMKTMAASLGYAQHITLRKNLKVIPSLQLEACQTSISGSWIAPGGLAVAGKKQSAADLSSGLLVNYKNFYGGVSVLHMVDLYKHVEPGLNLRTYNFYASYNFYATPYARVNVSILNQNSYAASHTQLVLNALLLNHFLVGAGWQHNDAGYLSFGYRENYFTAQMVYAPPISKLDGSNIPTLQASASFNLRNKENRKLVTNFEEW